MSRTALTLMGVVFGVGCLVVIVRGQEATTAAPGAFPLQPVPEGEPTPAVPLDSEYRPRGEPTPASQAADYQSVPTPAEPAKPSTSLKRQSAAERLQQVREATNRSAASKSASKAGTVLGPVTADPTILQSPRIEEQPSNSNLNSTGSKKPLSITDSELGGGNSVLKKAEPEPSALNERSTARRLLRSPSKSTSTPKATSAPSQVAIPVAATPKVTKSEAVIQSRGPALRVETTGPKTLKLGSEAAYVIHIHNDGDVEANDVFIRAGLPASAKVVAEGSSADAARTTDAPNEQRFVWTIARLPARGSETLTMRVTPMDSTPLDLYVDWTTRPISAVAQIEVQQPQLEMSVFGPKDIAYGEAAKYTIRLSNPGNGDADQVTVDFGYGQEKLEPKTIGTLAAGQQQEISLELIARQAGALPVIAVATAAGGLRAEASQEVLVRRAALEAEVTGDPAIFAGSPATYRVVLRNAGNAAANQVSATVLLPEGAQVLRTGDEAKPTQNGLVWNVGILPPNGERTLEVQAMLTVAGDNAVNVRVSGASDLETTGSFVTRVEALADLKLTVNDPQGPIAVGQEAVYEIHITNRGTKAATKINVVAQFSPGIEPIEATGAQAELVPGQVLFEAVPRIDPGQEVTLIVRAKADAQGPKRFRAEVSCEELDTQLVAQETTYFFTDSSSNANKTSKAKPATIKR
jgi:uncharacterized repeat protein (TIGR01451 family)